MDPDDDQHDEPPDPADLLMRRGEYLRKLRELERMDEEARKLETTKNAEEQIDRSDASPQILDYSKYLSHQTYYDDLKHIDFQFIDFGFFGPGRLVLEQDKGLGKGGLCWDAAFCLGEHLVATKEAWLPKERNSHRVVELGSGTGLCGMILAKTINNVHVELTDLELLIPLMKRNLNRNFRECSLDGSSGRVSESNEVVAGMLDTKSNGSASVSLLDWDQVVSGQHQPLDPYDVILGADVVASLYNPISLAQTIYLLARDHNTVVYVSFKERLSSFHRQFETSMSERFSDISIISTLQSRNRNPDVLIFRAKGKISLGKK